MSRRTYSGREVVKALRKMRFRPAGRSGSHVRLVYKHPDGETRRVTVPMHKEITEGTLRKIAEQAGAKDFDKFCEWIDELS